MVYGFVADVHGNLSALTRALESLAGVDRRFFLGDLAGGREVRECLQLLQGHQFLCVPGNHDTWDFELAGLTAETISEIRAWPLQRDEADFVAAHSDYEKVEASVRFPYIHSESDAQRALAFFPQRLVFFGHTHVSQIHEMNGDGNLHFQRATLENNRFTLDPRSRYLVNVGAAPDCTVIYDAEKQEIKYHFFGPPPQPRKSPPPVRETSLWERFKASFRAKASRSAGEGPELWIHLDP